MYNYFIALMVFCFISCQQNIYFDEASPPGVKGLQEIPVAFQGVFMCERDSSLIFSDENIIYKEAYHAFTAHIDEIEDTEECSIVMEDIYFKDRDECVPFEFLNDSIILAKVYEVDTLFDFSASQVVKLYKGRLFLNYKNFRDEWSTFMISPLSDGSLLWEFVDFPKSHLDSLPEIVNELRTRETPKGETKYILKPTLVEFDQIINKKYMIECDHLIPLNMEH